MIAGDEHVGDARHLLSRGAPLAAGLGDQAIDDVERGVEEPSDVGQHVGHAHQVVEVLPRAPVRLAHGHQAKEVLERQRDAHKGVVFHALHVHQRVGLHDAFGHHVLAEHLPAAGYLVDAEGRHVGVHIGHVKFAHQRRQLGGRRRVRIVLAQIDRDVGEEEFGVGIFAQQADDGACDFVAHQLLAHALEIGRTLRTENPG